MYTIKEAALRTGISVPALRAWERRYGVVAPTRTAAGYRLYDDRALERLRTMRALVDAGWTPADIDYINAHGTSTPANDLNETKAIKAVFGDHAKTVAVSSTKSMTGHMLGAAGAVEFIIGSLATRDSIIPPTINYQTPDPELDLKLTRQYPEALVIIELRGTPKKPELHLTSDPSVYDQSQIVSLILTGQTGGQPSTGKAFDPTAAVAHRVTPMRRHRGDAEDSVLDQLAELAVRDVVFVRVARGISIALFIDAPQPFADALRGKLVSATAKRLSDELG